LEAHLRRISQGVALGYILSARWAEKHWKRVCNELQEATINPIINILNEIAPIAQWTVWPTVDAQGEELSCPPVIAWSYEQPTEDLRDFLHVAVGSFKGNVSWRFHIVEGQRWIVLPSRILEYTFKHKKVGFLIAAAKVRDLDPEFGQRANGESQFLSQHIHCCLKEKKSA
jgi:hypothetical protein